MLIHVPGGAHCDASVANTARGINGYRMFDAELAKSGQSAGP